MNSRSQLCVSLLFSKFSSSSQAKRCAALVGLVCRVERKWILPLGACAQRAPLKSTPAALPLPLLLLSRLVARTHSALDWQKCGPLRAPSPCCAPQPPLPIYCALCGQTRPTEARLLALSSGSGPAHTVPDELRSPVRLAFARLRFVRSSAAVRQRHLAARRDQLCTGELSCGDWRLKLAQDSPKSRHFSHLRPAQPP